MEAAVTNQDNNLSSDIQAAVSGVTDLINGAKADLAASVSTITFYFLQNTLKNVSL